MPQVDLETLVCGDRKIVCETLIDGQDKPNSPPAPPPDLPADSFRLPTIEDEIDWVDRNAFFERKQSTRGISSLPNSGHLSSNSSSQRIPLHIKSKSKPFIIGLPKRPDSRQICHASRRNCRSAASIQFFPKPSGKSAVPGAEPVSPKVSCVGRVRLKEKTSHRRNRSPTRRTGIWVRFLTVFGRRRKQAVVLNEKPPSPRRRDEKERAADVGQISAVVVPSLGGMKKLASGRKPESWGSDGELDVDVHVAGDDWKDVDAVCSRLSVGRPKAVDCVRDWECVGPATV